MKSLINQRISISCRNNDNLVGYDPGSSNTKDLKYSMYKVIRG